MGTHKELHEGIGGNGRTVYLVVTVRDADGSWRYTEPFTNEAEAISWLNWA